MTKIEVRRALVSVYDKTGLEELARGLADAGVEIVSTGSTAARIRDLGVAVTPVEEVTGFPEILGGRVKTLHPHVHAGLLADQTDPAHVDTIAELGIQPFQLLVVNLYPFAATVAQRRRAARGASSRSTSAGRRWSARAPRTTGRSPWSPTRAATPTCSAAVRSGGFDLAARQRLAAAAFRHTATYDIGVASWLGNVVAPDDGSSGFPGWVGASWERAAVLRYGENPHQRAALYVTPDVPVGVAHAEQLQGKEMSYNNYVDADAAWRAAYDFAEPCVAIIKHANPCGIAVGADVADAHRKAHACDPVSAFGGVIATNRPVDRRDGRARGHDLHRGDRRAGLRRGGARGAGGAEEPAAARGSGPADRRRPAEIRPVSGGLLMQSADRIDAPGDDPAAWTLQAGEAADDADAGRPRVRLAGRARGEVERDPAGRRRRDRRRRDGPGQPGRLVPARGGAGRRAGGRVGRGVRRLLPVRRRPEVLIDAGVRAIVEPGGSIRDDETIAAAKEADVALYFTGTRHFAH